MRSESPTVSWNRIDGELRKPRSTPSPAVFDGLQDLFGRKWNLRILYHLFEDGPLGFSALKDRLAGISSKMLAESLSTLEAEGIVSRDRLSETPIRVEYSLTERGATLEPIVAAIVRWGDEHAQETDNRSGER